MNSRRSLLIRQFLMLSILSPCFQIQVQNWCYIYFLMCERKAWSKEEDQLLVKIMQEEDSEFNQRKLKWNDIAIRINQLTTKTVRRGKQCRQRWFNQLHPNINKEPVWTAEQEKILFKCQEEYGNHWAKISKKLPGRSDNNIKNYFYSCLRKALRKVNNFVNYNKRNSRYKNLKAFQASTLSKILAVAENKAQNKILIVKQNAFDLAKQIKNMLVQIQVFQKTDPIEKDSTILSLIVQKIQDFNRICKRKKSKRKVEPNKKMDNILIDNDQESQNIDIDESLSNSQMIPEANSESSSQLSEKDQSLNKPLQKSQPTKTINQGRSLTFPNSIQIDQRKKIGQSVIIPSCKYNCQSKNLNLSQTNSQIKGSVSTISNTKSQHGTANHYTKQFLPIIPFAHPTYHHGSAFMPTTYYPFQYSNPAQCTLQMSFILLKQSQSFNNSFANTNKLNPFLAQQCIHNDNNNTTNSNSSKRK